MKRVGRWLFNLAAVLSILLGIGIALACVYFGRNRTTSASYTSERYRGTDATVIRRSATAHLNSYMLVLVWSTRIWQDISDAELTRLKREATGARGWYAIVDRPLAVAVRNPESILNKLGFNFLGEDTRWANDGWTYNRLISVPAWIAVLPLISFGIIAAWRNGWRPSYRRKSNLCPTCGYDLRATPERCPECGTIPIAVKGTP